MKVLQRHDRKALRQFFWTLGAAIVLMFYLVLPWLFDGPRSSIVLYIAAAIAASGTLLPSALYPLYRAWMVLARALGWINSRVLLGFAFFAMVWPIGWVARRLGKLGYRARPPSNRETYRTTRERTPTREDLERPF